MEETASGNLCYGRQYCPISKFSRTIFVGEILFIEFVFSKEFRFKSFPSALQKG